MRLGNDSVASAGILVCVFSKMTNQQPCGSTLSFIYVTSSGRGHLNHLNRQMPFAALLVIMRASAVCFRCSALSLV